MHYCCFFFLFIQFKSVAPKGEQNQIQNVILQKKKTQKESS